MNLEKKSKFIAVNFPEYRQRLNYLYWNAQTAYNVFVNVFYDKLKKKEVVMKKPDLHEIAFRINEDGYKSCQAITTVLIDEALLEAFNEVLSKYHDEVLEMLQEMEHGEPRNSEEYFERYGK
jgi:hypothetical protein